MYMLDVVIIGAGVSGAFIARKLARYELNVALFERENDVGDITSNANSAIVHSGYDPVPHTLKALLNVRGNAMFDQIADELDVHFNRHAPFKNVLGLRYYLVFLFSCHSYISLFVFNHSNSDKNSSGVPAAA